MVLRSQGLGFQTSILCPIHTFSNEFNKHPTMRVSQWNPFALEVVNTFFWIAYHRLILLWSSRAACPSLWGPDRSWTRLQVATYYLAILNTQPIISRLLLIISVSSSE